MDLTFIQRFAPVITATQAPTERDERLLMDREGDLSVYHAPFESTNRQAKVALVGITPGPTQMVNALQAARSALAAGSNFASAVQAAKATGAFSGEPLRGNLVRQLRHWGVDRWLGLKDADELFGSARHLVQTTSLLRFPVFVGDTPYAGNPDMTRHPLLRRHLMEHFVREAQALPDAIFVALGPTVAKVLQWLVDHGHLPADRVALGMLHPSGNCTYRINYLVGPRSGPAPHATNVTAYDQGRVRFLESHRAGTVPAQAAPFVPEARPAPTPIPARPAATSAEPKFLHPSTAIRHDAPMGLLTDIAIQHTYRGKKSPAPLTFTMHPFENTQGEHAGLFEVLRDVDELPKKVKRSTHLTRAELAELYARGLVERFAIRLRLRPGTGQYPDAPPGKKVPAACIVAGSDFDRRMRAVNVKTPMSEGLRLKLTRLGL